MGLAHIGGKHGADTIIHVLDAIANGRITRYVVGNRTVVLEKDGYQALLALTRYGEKDTWLFNGWEKIETTGENGKVSANTVSMQANPTFSRTDLGAAISRATKLLKNSESDKPYIPDSVINASAKHVEHLSQSLGVDIVMVDDVTKVEGYNEATEEEREAMNNSKGWYNPRNGKIYVIAGQHSSVADLERTVFHEAVGHRGVHGLLGDRFVGFCDRLFKSLDKGMQSALHRTHDRKEPLSDAALGAEYIAEIAEKGEWQSEGERNMWYKTVRWVRQQMMLMGFSFFPTEDDIRYLLYTASKKGNRLRTEQLRQRAEASHDEMQDVIQAPSLYTTISIGPFFFTANNHCKFSLIYNLLIISIL
jgi:hypothetical protein